MKNVYRVAVAIFAAKEDDVTFQNNPERPKAFHAGVCPMAIAVSHVCKNFIDLNAFYHSVDWDPTQVRGEPPYFREQWSLGHQALNALLSYDLRSPLKDLILGWISTISGTVTKKPFLCKVSDNEVVGISEIDEVTICPL